MALHSAQETLNGLLEQSSQVFDREESKVADSRRTLNDAKETLNRILEAGS